MGRFLPLILAVFPLGLPAQDAGLLSEIKKIRAIDHHAHPMRYAAPGEAPDTEYDALPLEGLEPAPSPFRLRPENPEYAGAWRALRSGAGSKPPRAAVVKGDGGECCGKRRDKIPSGMVQGDERRCILRPMYSETLKMWTLARLLLCISAAYFLAGSLPVWSQNRELAAVGGLGGIAGSDVQTDAAAAIGLSFKTRLGRPEVKFDYEFLFPPGHFRDGLHAVTAAWLIQKRSGRTRPFVQLGVAAAYSKQRTRAVVVLPDGTPFTIDHTETEFDLGPAIGAGATVDLSDHVFMRPEFRLKILAPGPILTLVPAMTVGYRF